MEFEEKTLITYGIMFGLCTLIGAVCFWGKRKGKIFSFCLQGIISICLLLGIEKIITSFTEYTWFVPASPISLSVCFFLGFPGLALLYGIKVAEIGMLQ